MRGMEVSKGALCPVLSIEKTVYRKERYVVLTLRLQINRGITVQILTSLAWDDVHENLFQQNLF